MMQASARGASDRTASALSRSGRARPAAPREPIWSADLRLSGSDDMDTPRSDRISSRRYYPAWPGGERRFRYSNRVLAGTAMLAQPHRATAPGVKGATPCRRRHSCEEPLHATDVPFVGPALRTHHSLWNPRGLVRGHPTRCPRLDTRSFREIETRRASGGQRGLAPLHSPPGCPWTRMVSYPVSAYWTGLGSGRHDARR